ncbi:ATP-binding protein [Streptomyces sp. SAJ15]|uniref:ATP-binding protein n=1 Tax=Streptomyces sp. SAJ15 TaxID=2011095 RepID=UPI001185ECBD|nr:ATP-binding protein [Streptomyces sp. SAJ15]TVL93982.1 ATP-binding protein [Streptomyces sp. SAJ15]
MSLPLSRRIARAALLVAAGAAPLVGAVGAANAAEMPQTGLGGLNSAQAPDTTEVAKGAAAAGGQALGKTLPAAGKAAGKVVSDSISTDAVPLDAATRALG